MRAGQWKCRTPCADSTASVQSLFNRAREGSNPISAWQRHCRCLRKVGGSRHPTVYASSAKYAEALRMSIGEVFRRMWLHEIQQSDLNRYGDSTWQGKRV